MGFMDDVKDTAKSVANAAGKKTEAFVASSKLRLKISQTERELKSVYEKLGGAVYSMKKNDFENAALVDSLCGEVDDLLETLNALNEKLSKSLKQKLCPSCGGKNPNQAAFCSHCGRSLWDASSRSEEEDLQEPDDADAFDPAQDDEAPESSQEL